MIGDLGAPELLIILALVVLLFGVGKLGRLGKDLGTAVREFRSAVTDSSDAAPVNAPAIEAPAPDPAAAVVPHSAPGEGPKIF